MFTFAILIGIYSYLILALGLSNILYREIVVIVTLAFLGILFFTNIKRAKNTIKSFAGVINSWNIKKIAQNRIFVLVILLILLQGVTNFIGVLGPELGFDALWYHLTLPKIYLTNHSILHIPGGLLYYSDMPKLTEMLYTVSLMFGNETTAKLIHFLFGIFTLIALYKISRKFFSLTISFLALGIFYSNLVVGWQSTTAYVDLARTFFEVMSVWGFINWVEKKEKKWLIESAVMLGLALSAKLLAFGSLIIFSLLIIYAGFKNKTRLLNIITNILVYWCFAILIILPWLVFAFINSGNPIYPFFTSLYKVSLSFDLMNPLNFTKDIVFLFTRTSDRISPLYILFFPLSLFIFKTVNFKLKLVILYVYLAIFVWYFTPRTGGGRFILPYLPIFSIVCAAVINEFTKTGKKVIFNILAGLILFYLIFSIGYRFTANLRYAPVILGAMPKSIFLKDNLNFLFGDFYDTDNYFKKNIKKDDKVLLYGFHNLFYIDFPFIDSSWIKRGDMFNYIAVQNGAIPERFKYWNLIYHNSKTKVNLYSLGGTKWVY